MIFTNMTIRLPLKSRKCPYKKIKLNTTTTVHDQNVLIRSCLRTRVATTIHHQLLFDSLILSHSSEFEVARVVGKMCLVLFFIRAFSTFQLICHVALVTLFFLCHTLLVVINLRHFLGSSKGKALLSPPMNQTRGLAFERDSTYEI